MLLPKFGALLGSAFVRSAELGSTASQTMSASVASEPVPVDPLRVLRSVCSGLEKPPGALSPQRPPALTRVHLPTVFARRVAAKPELWEQLELLCPEALPLAAEILDHKTILRCVARDSKREFYTVSASAKQVHCCIPGWCSCNSYAFEVLSSRKLVCKHELAVLVATAMDDRVHTNTIDDEKWVRLQVDVGGAGALGARRLAGARHKRAVCVRRRQQAQVGSPGMTRLELSGA